jgi:hypothetical protein
MTTQQTQTLNGILAACPVLTQIHTTTNYDLFGIIGGNREINKKNLNKIKKSIKKKYIKTNAIICAFDPSFTDGNYLKVVDGQHRLEACRSNGETISFVVDLSLDYKTILNDITLLNTASKEWDVNDFMGSEAQKGNPSYQLYQKIYCRYSSHFDHEALYYIMNNKPGAASRIDHEKFKLGLLRFDYNDYLYLDSRLNDLQIFASYSDEGGKRYYQKALNDLLNTNGFTLSQMIHKIQQKPVLVKKCNSIEAALKQLSDIYNHKNRGSKIYFNILGSKITGIDIK